MTLKFLKAYNGDCILIETLDENQEIFTILIDGGTSSTFEYSLKKELEKITRINLLILTHIDSDHIGGLIKFFQNSLINKIEIDEIWINHPELISVTTGDLISFTQGDNLKELINTKKPNTLITPINSSLNIIIRKGLQFEILSPDLETLTLFYKKWKPDFLYKTIQKENISQSLEMSTYDKNLEELSKIPFIPANSLENDLTNASSIAFILKTLEGKKLAFLADARPELIDNILVNKGYSSSHPLICDLVKLSHHGSKNNTSPTILDKIKSNQYFISTNGGSSNHKHPSRETIARIIYNQNRNLDNEIIIFTNYPIQEIKNKIGNFISDKDFESGNWKLKHQNEFILE